MMRFTWLLPLLCSSVAAGQGEAKVQGFEFSVRTLGGQQLTQDSFKDNVLIVDLWGTWCPPCRAAIPKLVELYGRYKHQGLEIVGFSYKSDGSPEDGDAVRKFAVENHITYSLAAGDPKVREQVPGFRGYPTLLLFQKGMKNEAIHVGYSDEEGEKLEQWIKQALGGESAAAPGNDAAKGEPDPVAEEAKRVKEEKVPKGKLFMPGNGDTFEFEANDANGEKVRFSDLQGKVVLVALTTTWDQEAANTAGFLKKLHQELPAIQVLAICLEKDSGADKKLAAVHAFRDKLGLDFPLIPASVKFGMDHIHNFAAVPTLLVFDPNGKLVMRQNGISDAITAAVSEQAAKLLAK